ncbi:MAG: acyl-CoA dehydrogenase family protein [Desulfobulbus sp.]|nr:acyl-CoA dehydrogenase family protein [Desulfobulbus sp.]
MSFELSKEQLMIQKMARDFARKDLAPLAAERDEQHLFPAASLKKMGELGLLGMLVSEQYGGEDMGTVSYALALSEIAAACASTAVIMSVHNSICCTSIEKYGSEAQKKQFLKPMTAGKLIGAFALTEPEAGSDAQAITCSAVREGDFYLLNGTKRFITSGKNGGVVIVLARTKETGSDGITAFLVTPDLPGFSVAKVENKMGQCASDTTDLLFDNCKVPADRVLGQEGEGFAIAMSGLDAGRIGIAALSVGVAQAALDEAIKYAKQRKQFGQAIAQFQGLQWMIADMAMDVEAARLMVLNAAAIKERGENCVMAASMAKCFASEMVNRVTSQAIQIHGGYGYVKEYAVERFYRDARVLTIYEGTNQIQRHVIARELLKTK